ncbi:extended synaptotagmin-1 [Boleophthalmus pectinirostris]|uniref:extended synaptotagmin-1 n=1 Tax=Boleophthalmus pectinirostris TaxID=150288 RepID=UPI00242B1072|nr:extended synaptotagmin-1 [Boleophthalmus pectinirostris]
MGGMVKGKSDPYVKINIGGETFTSQVIKANLNPTWNEMYEVILTQLHGQDLQLEVFDKDMDVKDDFMGRLKINLQDIIKSQYTDQWYTLNDVKSGRVHLVLEWVPTSSESDHVDQVLTFLSRQSYQNKAIPSAALLFVFIEQADGLPVKKSGKDPKVGAEIRLDKQSRKTTVCERTTSPAWHEAFCFMVRDPREDILVIKLSHSWTLPIGSLVIPLRELLSEPGLVLDQWFHLDGGLPDSQVLLRTELKMLVPSKCPVPKEPKVSVPAPSDPVPAPRKQETDPALKSSTVDPTPVETIVPSVLVREEEEVKAAEAPTAEEEEEEEEEKVPVVTLPPHTSPDISFASEGMLRIVLLEAQSLVAKDKLMGGMVKGKSDPYAKITVGQSVFKSNVIKENLNPVWNEMYQVVLRAQAGQEVQLELFDKDMDSDDFMGRFKVSVADIIRSQFSDEWYTLNDVKSGRVRLILEWIPTVSHHASLDRVMQLQSLHSYKNKAVPTAALLFVYVDRAHSLPFKKSGKEPRPAVELVLGKTSHKTKVCDRSRAPEWKESFHFLVQNPTEEKLILKVSSAWDQPIGSVEVPVRDLLSEPQLVLDKWMNLDGALPESQILLRTELKILDSKLTEVPLLSVPGAAETEPTFKAVIEDQKLPEQLQPEPVSEWTQPQVQETDVEPEETHTSPHTLPSAPPAAEMEEEQEETEEQLINSGPTATEHLKPTVDTKGTGLEDLVQATVTGLPEEPAEVLPPNTTPNHDFATEGLLRILLLEARSLVAKDNLMGGMVKGKSDPYVNITIGKTAFKSHVIKENLNPTWNEMYEVVLKADSAQEIHVEAFDKDLDSDDFLGRFSINLKDVIRSQYTDQWYTLNDVKSGRIHLILEWVPTVTDPARLDQILQLQSLQTYQNKAVLSAALLFVYLERAHSLPLKKSGKEPKAGAELTVGQTSYKSQLCERTSSPEWNESFYFNIKNPKDDMLIVKLSSGWEQPMGSVVVPVRSLLSGPGLVLDEWLSLDGATPQSQILLRAQLKILDSRLVDLMLSGSLPSPSGNGQIRMSLFYQTQERKLTVTVHECRDLLSQSKDGVDSYVSLMLLPDKHKSTKKKTAVKKKVLDPEFNERFEFDLPLEEVKQRHLSVSVKNNASFRGPDVIGQVQIALAEINLSGVTQWFTLKDEAD